MRTLFVAMLPGVISMSLSPALSLLSPPLAPLRTAPFLPPAGMDEPKQHAALKIMAPIQSSMRKWSEQCTAREITIAGAVTNVLLCGLKAGVGCLTSSASLIADAGHSLSDLLSDGLALCASAVPTWERECTLGIALMLGSTGVVMVYHAGLTILDAVAAALANGPAVASAGVCALDAVGLCVALASIASKEALFRITHAVGLRSGSSTLLANAHHHRSDAMSSVAAAVGICGTLAGFRMLDSLAALVVGAMVFHLGIETAGSA